MQLLKENALQSLGNLVLRGVDAGLRQQTAEARVLGLQLDIFVGHIQPRIRST